MAETTTFLVRHGRYDHRSRALTEDGRTIDAARARDDLLGRGLGSRAVVLSSAELRAVQTAEVIAEGLGTSVVPSKKIAMGGIKPSIIGDLDEFLGTVLEEAGIDRSEDTGLVVVAHAPLVAVVAQADEGDVDFGQVAAYTAGSWVELSAQHYLCEKSDSSGY